MIVIKRVSDSMPRYMPAIKSTRIQRKNGAPFPIGMPCRGVASLAMGCFGVCGAPRKSQILSFSVCGAPRKLQILSFDVCGAPRKHFRKCLGRCTAPVDMLPSSFLPRTLVKSAKEWAPPQSGAMRSEAVTSKSS